MDTASYAAYVGWALLLPGVLVYRAFRGTPRALVDDLAMGLVVGLTMEIAAWAMFSALDLRGLLGIWPVAVVLPFVLVRTLRRHWRPRGYGPPPLAWSWCVAGVIILVITHLWITYLRGPEPVPTSGTTTYFHDLMYMLSLVGEAKHHFPLALPQVASEPLYYHWFAYAHEASASLISGVDTPVVYFRMSPVFFCLGSLTVLAVAGWRVAGSPWAGTVAVALMFAVGELSVGPMGPNFNYVALGQLWASQSQVYGNILLAGLVALVADRLRGPGIGSDTARPAEWGKGTWVLLALVCLGATGAKSTLLPIVLAGLGTVIAVRVVRSAFGRRRETLADIPAPRAGQVRASYPGWPSLLLVTGIVLVAELFAVVVLYGGESSGLAVRFIDTLGPYVPYIHQRALWKNLVLFGIAALAWSIYMLTRVAGVPVLAWLARRQRSAHNGSDQSGSMLGSWAAPEWFLFGGLLAGAGGALVLGHPTGGQQNLIRAGFLGGAILSAQGYVALVERCRVPARLVAGFVVIGCAVAVAVVWVTELFIGRWLVAEQNVLRPVFANAVGILVVLALGSAVWSAIRRRSFMLRGKGPVLALTVVLAAGLPTLGWDAYNQSRHGLAAFVVGNTVTADRLAAARWLRANSDPHDVVAVNHACRDPAKACGTGGEFWLEAFSERQLLVGEWLYAPREVSADMKAGVANGGSPFWDAQLLADNEAAFYAPTADGIAALNRDHDVRWFVVDRRSGLESPQLRRLIALRFELDQMAIYEVTR